MGTILYTNHKPWETLLYHSLTAIKGLNNRAWEGESPYSVLQCCTLTSPLVECPLLAASTATAFYLVIYCSRLYQWETLLIFATVNPHLRHPMICAVFWAFLMAIILRRYFVRQAIDIFGRVCYLLRECCFCRCYGISPLSLHSPPTRKMSHTDIQKRASQHSIFLPIV